MSNNRLELGHTYMYAESNKDQYLSPYSSRSRSPNSGISSLNSKRIRANSLLGEFEELEIKFSQYEMIKVPEFRIEKEDLNKEIKKITNFLATPSPESGNKDISLRIKRDLLPTPFIKARFRSPTFSINCINLGPGDYSPDQKKTISGGYFPLQPRFDESIEDKVEWFLSKRRKKNLSFSNKISERNQDMTQYLPEKKSKIHCEKVHKHNITLETVREAKRRIDKMNREAKEGKLKYKMKRFMFNEKRTEFKQIYISWIALASIVGLHTIFYYKTEGRKRRRGQVRKQISFFCLISRILGKLKLSLVKNRRINLIWKLSKNAMRIKKWVNNRRSLLLKILDTEIFKRSNNQNTLLQLMAQYWKYKRTLQIGLKRIIEIKRARFHALGLLWVKIQSNLIKKYRKSGKIKVDKPEKLIPQKVIEENLQKYFQAQAKSYLEKYNKYKAECREADEYKERELKEIEFDALLSENIIYEITECISPQAPTFVLYSNENLLKKRVMQVIHFYAVSKIQDDFPSPKGKNRFQRRSVQIYPEEYARFQNKIRYKDETDRRRPSNFAL
ncbi:unnamed protein product [Blepharisma stoltei]|uniref:Uncharacterized protein n=1 Tax=Blepharisma stoltei TaxID=1481888 RepID=A0AAU9J971_9CILI|nr:unnamed protein product [Blepharisma stoltei]